MLCVGARRIEGLVYNYFDSKEALLVALMQHATERMALVAAPLAPGASLEDSLATFVDGLVGFLRTEREFLKLQFTLMLLPELSEVVMGPRRERAERLLETLTHWVKCAGLSEPRRRARLLLALFDGIALHYLVVFENYPLTSMRTQLLTAAQRICEDGE